jgi:hypothetical protein
MTHGQIYKYAAGSFAQRRHNPTQKAWVTSPSGKRTGRSIRHIQTPGISLRKRSPNHRATDSDTRLQDRLYREALQKSNPITTSICPGQRANHKRSRYTGLRNLSLQRSEAWTSRGKSISRLNLSIVLTDTQLGKSVKPINISCLTGHGLRLKLMTL